jgi:phosphatidylethanolamine-binding protein (PEBP) family uncharacterized protein
MTNLRLTSPAFDGGDSIPDRYGYTEEDVNPPLSIDGVPEEAVSLLLLVDDPDAVEPGGHIWEHWLVWDVSPDRKTVPESWSPESATEGQSDYGGQGYGGPNPRTASTPTGSGCTRWRRNSACRRRRPATTSPTP